MHLLPSESVHKEGWMIAEGMGDPEVTLNQLASGISSMHTHAGHTLERRSLSLQKGIC